MNLHKSATDRVFAGICGGLGETLGVNALWLRLLFVFGGGILFWVYLALAITLPDPD
ncbi:PspC domain-containing protein [Lacticaseibacillus absianus]|uniref:PspC domain-containing protein n=1 Tax=Lacticaseibacillus absianus TaxID=2729623 RepID=UPI0015CE39DD|nr:PspC domain-containing protein [Lacticaseibacillus absianus]